MTHTASRFGPPVVSVNRRGLNPSAFVCSHRGAHFVSSYPHWQHLFLLDSGSCPWFLLVAAIPTNDLLIGIGNCSHLEYRRCHTCSKLLFLHRLFSHLLDLPIKLPIFVDWNNLALSLEDIVHGFDLGSDNHRLGDLLSRQRGVYEKGRSIHAQQLHIVLWLLQLSDVFVQLFHFYCMWLIISISY